MISIPAASSAVWILFNVLPRASVAARSMFSPQLIRSVIDDSGKKIGLGDYRPQRKGPFGRFVVKQWAVVQDDLKAAA